MAVTAIVVPRIRRWLIVSSVGIAAAAVLGGCTQGQWSPTGDAMASAESRGVFGTPVAASAGGRTEIAVARPTNRRTLVLAQDGYSRLASEPTITDASNTTMTAGVGTEE